MTYTEHTCTPRAPEKPVTADSIVNEILLSDTPENILHNLREMMDAFFLYYPEPTEHFKYSVYGSYYTLTVALRNLAILNQGREI